jgi:hypothetical protein
MSIARRTFPSSLELKRRAGSFRDAPLAKVSLTAFLLARSLGTQTRPSQYSKGCPPYPAVNARYAPTGSRNVEFSVPLKDTDDGLRGFELKDADGYVLFSTVLVHERQFRCGSWSPPWA